MASSAAPSDADAQQRALAARISLRREQARFPAIIAIANATSPYFTRQLANFPDRIPRGYAMPRRITLRQVEAFKAVIEQGSVSSAAQMLHISQPAMSKLIAYF